MHVLSMPPAFALSQDQTLRFITQHPAQKPDTRQSHQAHLSPSPQEPHRNSTTPPEHQPQQRRRPRIPPRVTPPDHPGPGTQHRAEPPHKAPPPQEHPAQHSPSEHLPEPHTKPLSGHSAGSQNALPRSDTVVKEQTPPRTTKPEAETPGPAEQDPQSPREPRSERSNPRSPRGKQPSEPKPPSQPTPNQKTATHPNQSTIPGQAGRAL